MQELELNELQDIQLTLMRELDEICQKHHIKYSIMYGSLIGAVRHKGFIPWDDDIDIVVMREDYEKLINVLEQEKREDRFVQNMFTDKHFEFGITRYCMKKTYCFSPERKKLKSKKYIYIDIFPLDNLPDDETLAQKQKKKVYKIKRLIYYKMNYKYPHRTIFGYLKTFLYAAFTKLIPLRHLLKKLKKAEMKYASLGTERLISFEGIYKYEKETVRRADFVNTKLYDYGEDKFYGPDNPDFVLTNLYGDYMTPTPVEKRVKRHHCYALDHDDDVPPIARSHSIKSNYIFNLIVVILESIIPLVTTPFIARIIEPQGTGIYSYTYSLISMFTLAGALGSATHGQRQIAMHTDDKQEYSKIFWEIFTLRLIFVTLSFVIFLITILITGKYVNYFLLQIPYFLAAIFDISWLYQGLEEFKYIAVKNLLVKLLGIGTIFIFVRSKDDLWLYLIILSLSIFFGQISLWLRLNRYVTKVKPKTLNWKRHFKEVMVYFVPTIAYQLYSLIDKVILGAISTEEETGYYEQSQKIINLCVSFLSAYNVVIRSRMSYLFTKKDKKQIDDKIHKSIAFVFMLALPVALGIIGIARGFVPWYLGDKFAKVSNLLMIFAPIVVIISVRTCIGATIFTPFGLQKKSNIAQIIAAIVNCAVTAILIPWLASIGAVLSSILAETIILIYYLIYCRKKGFISFKRILLSIYKYIIASALMLVAVWFLGDYVSGIKGTVIQILVGAIIYGVTLLILRDRLVTDNVRKILHLKKKGVNANG